MAGSDQRPVIFYVPLLLLISLLAAGCRVAEGSSRTGSSRELYAFQPTKLFVFGDSYADTGNTLKNESSSWKVPYGITFPGKPTGRFTSGRLLTDYLAKSFGLKSPVPYQWREIAGEKYLQYGMNFAYGGSGVTTTLVSYPNMTAQISLFEQLLEDKTFSVADLNSSVTLVTLSGNDYSAYLARNNSIASLPAFITTVVTQLGTNLRQLYELGARKVAVAGLQPLGCLPTWTAANSFTECNGTINALVNYHNRLLSQTVANLNNQTGSSTFVLVDLYTSFMTVLNSTDFENPMLPCCVGVSSGYSCGSVDGNGTKMYSVCAEPESLFFWDLVHPTQAGWRAAFRNLKPDLLQQL